MIKTTGPVMVLLLFSRAGVPNDPLGMDRPPDPVFEFRCFPSAELVSLGLIPTLACNGALPNGAAANLRLFFILLRCSFFFVRAVPESGAWTVAGGRRLPTSAASAQARQLPTSGLRGSSGAAATARGARRVELTAAGRALSRNHAPVGTGAGPRRPGEAALAGGGAGGSRPRTTFLAPIGFFSDDRARMNWLFPPAMHHRPGAMSCTKQSRSKLTSTYSPFRPNPNLACAVRGTPPDVALSSASIRAHCFSSGIPGW